MTPTPLPLNGAPELPEPTFFTHDYDLRGVAHAVTGYTADQMREYARAAIQQAAGAVPEGLRAAAKAANKHWNEFGPQFGFDECMDALDRALSASPSSPVQPDSGHLGAGGRVPLTDEQIEAIATSIDHTRPFWHDFTRAIEAARGINPGSATREDEHE